MPIGVYGHHRPDYCLANVYLHDRTLEAGWQERKEHGIGEWWGHETDPPDVLLVFSWVDPEQTCSGSPEPQVSRLEAEMTQTAQQLNEAVSERDLNKAKVACLLAFKQRQREDGTIYGAAHLVLEAMHPDENWQWLLENL